MSDKFIIQGGKKLQGQVEVRGSKNAAGAVIAASLLTDEPSVIDNLPLVSDILNLLHIVAGMGAEVEWLEKRKVRIRAGERVDPARLDFEKFSRSRVSVLLIGALLPRFGGLAPHHFSAKSGGGFKISRPGGDRIGLRPITTHLQALRELGVEVEEKAGFYYFRSPGRGGAAAKREIILPEFSVTATENLLMASALMPGETIIRVAAAEPQVQDLAKFLKKMGACIEGAGTHTLRVQGVKNLKGAQHRIIPDPLEAGTFIAIGAGNSNNLRVKNVEPEHLGLFLKELGQMGCQFTPHHFSQKSGGGFVQVQGVESLKPTRLQALPYPGFPTDLLPLVVPLLTQAQGKSLIHDPLYENRLNYIQELRKMGADIEIVDPHRAFVFGKTTLKGSIIESWDIRAGASLVVAGLMAQGKTIIENIEQIDRGYERIEERLQRLGAEIKRVKP